MTWACSHIVLLDRISLAIKDTQLTYPFHLTSLQIVVGNDEPQDVALKRFRREVAGTGLVQEVRRRRYFENSVDMKKRKLKEKSMKIKRARQGRNFTKSYGQTFGQETAPFTDLFGTPDDIFSDVLGSQDVLGSMNSVDFSR